jgi:16S rRNA (guanine527-N7)-methyltransferase
MEAARIAELLQPFVQSSHIEDPAANQLACPSQAQRESILTYINILLRWNSRINLTAIRDPEEIVTRHFGESLFAARHLFPTTVAANMGKPVPNGVNNRGRSALQRREEAREREGALAPEADDHPSLADLGSGAGFPGIPIKLWAPNASVTLIESNHKKAAFLREVIRALTLTDINIQNTRAETIQPGSFDIVTIRAVERFEAILPVAANLLAPGGSLALLIGTAQFESAREALSSFLWSNPLPIPMSRSRILAVGQREP